MNLDDFLTLAKTRRSVRSFDTKPVPADLIDRLLEAARWAPSGFNLQPTHWVVVTDPQLKQKLCPACMGQKQILQAPAVVVFCGDRHAYQNNMERSLDEDMKIGAINAKYRDVARNFMKLAFEQGPTGLGWIMKAFFAPALRIFKPTPNIPAVHKQVWVAKQVMLAAMSFMLAARSAGLSTVPMEGFDESRVKKLLGIPNHFIVPVLIPVGYSSGDHGIKSRLPFDSLTHRERW